MGKSESEKIKVEGGLVVFNSFETFMDFGKAINAGIWEPKRKAMREFFVKHPEHLPKLKELWFEIWAREWGDWGLTMTEHDRIFAEEAEKIVGEHDWLVPGNYFSGADLSETVAELLGEKHWRDPKEVKE